MEAKRIYFQNLPKPSPPLAGGSGQRLLKEAGNSSQIRPEETAASEAILVGAKLPHSHIKSEQGPATERFSFFPM
jgi:hypothetical protein